MTDPFVHYDQYGSPVENLVYDQYGAPVSARSVASQNYYKAHPDQMYSGAPAGTDFTAYLGQQTAWQEGVAGPGAGGAGASSSVIGGTAGAAGTGSSGTADGQLSGDQASAKLIIQQQLDSWGLSSLSDTLNDLIKQGLGSDAITLQLQQTQQYKDRFKANDARTKAGLAALSPAEYIATENSYRQVMQQYGLPATFYDQQSDFENFLEKDISPDEVKSRVQIAQTAFLSQDDATKSIWRDFYGLSDGAGIAAALDPDKALPILQNMAATATAGAEARRDGLVADQGRLSTYVDQGVTADAFRQGFGQIGQTLGAYQDMAGRFGGAAFDQAQAEQATLLNNATAVKRQTELAGSEKALFDSRAGAGANSLNRRQTGGY